jgi:uncharacterized membrane protein
VEMAERAMSPAINDPFTAMTCLDYIGEGLGMFLKQGERSGYYYDQDDKLRLILDPLTFGELLSGASDMVRHASCDNVSVLLHMLEVIEAVFRAAGSPQANQELLCQVGLIQAESLSGNIIAWDREKISRSCAELTNLLQPIDPY